MVIHFSRGPGSGGLGPGSRHIGRYADPWMLVALADPILDDPEIQHFTSSQLSSLSHPSLLSPKSFSKNKKL